MKGIQTGTNLEHTDYYKANLETELYIKLAIKRDHRRILAMFRCGNLPLHVETGRFARPKLPVEHCINSVEDELHFLIDCPFYLFVCFCCFSSHVNSYGHCGTVSSLNHTFSWAGLSKRLTSNLCTYFRL